MTEGGGNNEAFLAELYDELHRRAIGYMRGQRRDHTLQPTALVNEAYMRLAHAGDSKFGDRKHFLATASQAMRHVLVDHARRHARLKNKPPGERMPLDQITVSFEENAVDLLALDEALERLVERDPDMARAVELRFFGGMSMEETSEFLGIARRTFDRRWKFVRAWLHAEVT